MNNKFPPFIFSHFNSELIHDANAYIQDTYNTEGILYCTPQFAAEIINSIFLYPFKEQEQKIEEQTIEEQTKGWIGKYKGMYVVSMPELHEFSAILLPKIKIGDTNNE